jgi:hypothetical protein
VEALLHEAEHRSNRESRSGVLIGMAACALSGGLMGFILGLLVGLWL